MMILAVIPMGAFDKSTPFGGQQGAVFRGDYRPTEILRCSLPTPRSRQTRNRGSGWRSEMAHTMTVRELIAQLQRLPEGQQAAPVWIEGCDGCWGTVERVQVQTDAADVLRERDNV